MALTKIQTNLSHNLGVSALDYGAKGDSTTCLASHFLI